MVDTMKRLGLWVLGQMLPREEVFDRHIRHMARGVTFLVCGGMIVASVFLAILGMLYIGLVEQGLSAVLAAAITGIVALLGSVICFQMADKSLTKASKLTEELNVSTPSLPKLEANVDLQEGAAVLINAFLDGIRTPSSTAYHTKKHEELVERLEMLQAELEAELAAQEDIVRVEKEYDSDKDIIHFRPKNRRDEEAS